MHTHLGDSIISYSDSMLSFVQQWQHQNYIIVSKERNWEPGWAQAMGNHSHAQIIRTYSKCACAVASLRISPRTASDIDSDLLGVLTNSGRIGVRVTAHSYVPLSIEELRGENTTVLIKALVVGLCSSGKVTRPGTPENTAPSLVHLLVTITSLSVIPRLRIITQLRVKFLPA